MNDIFILVSNKGNLDWNRIIAVAPIVNEIEPDIMAVDANGKLSCVYEDLTEGCFYIINQENNDVDIQERIEQIFVKYKGALIFIAVHKEASYKLGSINCYPFHHASYCAIWQDYLEPYIDAVVLGEAELVKERFEKLRGFRKEDIAHLLRSEILSPFIPFHLFYQLDNIENKHILSNEWESILESCLISIHNSTEDTSIEKKINKLLTINDVPEYLATQVFDVYKSLAGYFSHKISNRVTEEECCHAIESLASVLENVVNYIEFGKLEKR